MFNYISPIQLHPGVGTVYLSKLFTTQLLESRFSMVYTSITYINRHDLQVELNLLNIVVVMLRQTDITKESSVGRRREELSLRTRSVVESSHARFETAVGLHVSNATACPTPSPSHRTHPAMTFHPTFNKTRRVPSTYRVRGDRF